MVKRLRSSFHSLLGQKLIYCFFWLVIPTQYSVNVTYNLVGVAGCQANQELKYSQTCVKRPYKTRHIFGFSDRWLLTAA